MISRTIKHLFAAASLGTLFVGCASHSDNKRMFRDEPSRPHTFAGCQPAWGYNQTCWQRFPELPPCDTNGSCFAQSPESHISYGDPGGIIVPQYQAPTMDQNYSGVQQSFIPLPQSDPIIAPNTGSPIPSDTRYGTATDTHSIPAPVSHFSAPPQTVRSAGPVIEQPAQPVPPVPGGTLALPPLPSPPEGIPSVPGQTRIQPQYEQLLIGADGRLTTTTAMTRNQANGASASRYGQINRPVASRQMNLPPSPQKSGPPVHFADAVTNPATQQNQRYVRPTGTGSRQTITTFTPSTQPVSRPQTGDSISSSRYGVTRPSTSNQAPSVIAVEPLQKTPGSYR